MVVCLSCDPPGDFGRRWGRRARYSRTADVAEQVREAPPERGFIQAGISIFPASGSSAALARACASRRRQLVASAGWP